MPSRIRILPDHVANRIAAGEVVQRPASVVKELVENALDAGATEITVEVRYGGKKKIRVVDNGEGMNRDDALLCLERHATSKIHDDQDLMNVSTMGFRGEALPSIASVCRIKIATRKHDAQVGTALFAEGGSIKKVMEAGMPAGTDVEVSDLFFNTPARKKFMKSPETELGHVVDTVTQLAVPKTDVGFLLRNNDQVLLKMPPAADLSDRLRMLLGREATESMIRMEGEEGTLSVRGYLSLPDHTRASTKYLYTYVNSRFTRDRLLTHAILEGYRGRLMKNRYPVAVVFIDLPPHHVDVNVHPQKREVKFRQSSVVHDAVARMVARALEPAESDAISGSGTGDSVGLQQPRAATADGSASSDPSAYRDRVRRAMDTFYERRSPREDASLPLLRDIRPAQAAPRAWDRETADARPEQAAGRFASLRVLGQLKDSYIVAQSPEGMVLIDQHAAHERVLFEKYKRSLGESSLSSQGLLFPVSLEVSHARADLLLRQIEVLGRLGIEVEHYGGTTFAIRGLPERMSEEDCRGLVIEVLEDIEEFERSGKLEDLTEAVAARTACRAAVKAGQRLLPEEINDILTQLDRTDLPEHCPHGRPVLRVFSVEEIERMFKRR